jgi:hypothetical protein
VFKWHNKLIAPLKRSTKKVPMKNELTNFPSLPYPKRNILGHFDPFRYIYRDLITKIMSLIVHLDVDPKTAPEFIKQHALGSLPLEDQDRFIEVIKAEIKGLHEGNIARYKISLSEYEAWRERLSKK